MYEAHDQRFSSFVNDGMMDMRYRTMKVQHEFLIQNDCCSCNSDNNNNNNKVYLLNA